MKPYWMTFEPSAPAQFGLGAGVTALDEHDAAKLARAANTSRSIIEISPVNSVDELDQMHVVVNMGNMLKRGIWFPLGYEHIA